MIEAIKRNANGHIHKILIYEIAGLKAKDDFCAVYPVGLKIRKVHIRPEKNKPLPAGESIAEITLERYPAKIMVHWLSRKIFKSRRCHCYVLTVRPDSYKNEFLLDDCPFCRLKEPSAGATGE